MAKIRVYELAKELGVESRELLAHLKAQGEFVLSASSTLEPPVVRRIRQQLVDNTPGQVADGPPTRPDDRPGGNNPYVTQAWSDRLREEPRRRRARGAGVLRPTVSWTRQASPELDEAARIFGVDRSDLKPARVGRGGTSEIDPWLKAWIDPAEKREWLKTGLTDSDLALVKQCKQIGMTPEDLRVALPHGDSPVRRLRQGEPVTHVKLRIDQARGNAG